jgi:hypothetical protein
VGLPAGRQGLKKLARTITIADVMNIAMDDSRLTNINQLRSFLKGSQKLDLSLRKANIEEKYEFIDQTVDRFEYHQLKRRDKRVVLAYLKKLTGYKRAQLSRLVNRAKRGNLEREPYQRTRHHRTYTPVDIKLLEKTDELHLRLNALATKEILRREYEVFGKEEYETIAEVSRSHLNNLRKDPIYRNSYVNPTKPSVVPIGITERPENFGLPGSVRVDTVHQRDVYHINVVDEVTQWEIVVCVPTISEEFLEIALEQIIDQCPFKIFNFHSDRGSEFINYVVAGILSELLIRQTKSRSRHPNDNALVETKNGAVIRKNMGWHHIDKRASDLINEYYQKYLNPYLNYHRPSLFATRVVTDHKGRERKIYDEATIPYEKLKEVSKLKGKKRKNFLKKGVTFEQLDRIAYEFSDNEFAKILRKQESILFGKIQEITSVKGGSRRKSRP